MSQATHRPIPDPRSNDPRDEGLISHGWPEDVWFHVDNLSSAHVYIRLPSQDSSSGVEAGNGPATSWTEIPEPLLADCAQLTKANSIEGNKKDNVTVIYTPWSNLHKDGSMKTGAVGFKDDKLVRKVFVKQRENAVINRLSKTRVERFPDLRAERQARDQGARAREAEAARLKVSRPLAVLSK